jgi:NAD(P)-dependent dehydrogenase (short-subunit alcohol dehydrogenase family)
MMPQKKPNERPVALVTGASYGIGGASAAALAHSGYDVGVTDLDTASTSATLSRVEEAGGKSFAFTLDVCNQASIETCLDKAYQAFGQVDLLVNNAGKPSPRAPIVDITRDVWDGIIAVNMTGAFFMSQQYAKRQMALGRPGLIISLASTFGIIGLSGASVYGISKAAVSHMTKMMAIEWASEGIRANAVAPGSTATETRIKNQQDPKTGPAMRARVPLNRFAEPDEIAAAISYLASPAASYITGHTLVLDGGLTVA